METLAKIIIVAILGIVGVAIFAALGAIPLYFLWNWLMPALFGLKTVTFLQAIGLIFLTSILFKSSTSSSDSSKSKSK